MARIEQKQNDWLEPMKEWIKVASNLVKIARDSNLLEKKVAAKEIFGSNLRLASRAVRGEPVFPFSAALRATESVGKISESQILVPGAGLEPACLAAIDFKSIVDTNFTTRAGEAAGGIEPPYRSFADSDLTTWLRRHHKLLSIFSS